MSYYAVRFRRREVRRERVQMNGMVLSPSPRHVSPVSRSKRSLALLLVSALAIFGYSAVATSGASAAQIDIPNNEQSLQATPSSIEGTAYYPIPLGLYESQVSVFVLKVDGPTPTVVAYGGDGLILTNQWEVDWSDFTRGPLPDGAPLPEGKYQVKAYQDMNEVFGSDDALWTSFFYIDGTPPDTVIDSATPASPTGRRRIS